jgi:4-aminobutyrate aminotransferase / (S)-3-amino-2-methylpropionate transaminase / 5-aminovalerate transaminase
MPTGLEVMRIFEETDYSARVSDAGAYFLEALRKLKSHHPELRYVRGVGLALRVEICKPDGRSPDPSLADRMFQ